MTFDTKSRSAVIASITTGIATTPPRSASVTLSVRNCLASRPRLAPSAARSATSRERLAARAMSRLATFALVISTSTPARPASAVAATRRNPPRSGFGRACVSGITRSEMFLCVSG